MTNYEIDILKKALLKVERKELCYFKNLPDENVEFSEEFEYSMQKLAKKRKTFVWQATKTIPRRIAVVFIAAIITFCLMMSVSAIRTPVIKFFVNIYEEFISIFVEEDEEFDTPDSIEATYLPSYMINGFSQISSSNNSKYAKSVWMDDNSNIIILTQDILEDDYQTQLDNETIGYENAGFNNFEVKYTARNGQYFFVWTNDLYMFKIICPTSIELNEIEKLVDSLTIVSTN